MKGLWIGIDYSLGELNIDPKTGIRYGVISQNSILQEWADRSKPFYGAYGVTEEEVKLEEIEPLSYYYMGEGYSMETCLDTDIMILKSPFYTFAPFCSPCIPGAGNLDDCWMEGGVKTYCPGHEWFDGGVAPYPIYRVKDDSLVAE